MLSKSVLRFRIRCSPSTTSSCPSTWTRRPISSASSCVRCAATSCKRHCSCTQKFLRFIELFVDKGLAFPSYEWQRSVHFYSTRNGQLNTVFDEFVSDSETSLIWNWSHETSVNQLSPTWCHFSTKSKSKKQEIWIVCVIEVNWYRQSIWKSSFCVKMTRWLMMTWYQL